jgi:hypothetical protein
VFLIVPVPEPTAVLGVAATGLALAWAVRRRAGAALDTPAVAG